MFSENNSIIVLDDDEESLKRIAHVFNLHGIGCKIIQVEPYNLPVEPLQGVRLVFLDINYITTGDNKAVFGLLCNVLRAYISVDNGPFVLVFWTTHINLINEFKAFVNRDQTYKSLPNPIAIFNLDKNAFQEDGLLLDEVEKIYTNGLVKCLFSFESELKLASEDCLYQITKLVHVDEPWGENSQYQESIKILFRKIAIEMLGFDNGKKYPDRAIKEMLAPVFLYSLLNNNSTTWQNFLDFDHLEKDDCKSIKIGNNLSAYLNTYMHICLDTSDVEARGCVRLVNCDDDVFKNCIGFSKKGWLENRMPPEKVQIKDSPSLIALEISAACDYAQGKKRLHKYILGLMYNYDQNNSIANKCKQCGDNIYDLNFSFIYQAEVRGIVLDFNSVISEESSDVFPILGEALFLFKNDLMNAIMSKYSNHISRIGFNCFRK